MKDLLLNVGSGGGAAAPAAGGAAATGGGGGGADEEAPKEEEKKEEGKLTSCPYNVIVADVHCRERRVRRRYGFWSLRLIACGCLTLSCSAPNNTFMELRYTGMSRL